MIPRVVLASASPRRRELLEAIVPSFDVRACEIDEEAWMVPPYEQGARGAAMAKARQIAGSCGGAVVIGADTVVTVAGRVLGKPANTDEAAAMLRQLSGREHSVITGLAVVSPGRSDSASETTAVTFAPLSEEQIAAYVRTGEPMDKAGAYGIQGRASVFIERIDGCYFNVVGLPLFRLGSLLALHGVTPWEHWAPDEARLR